MQAQKRKMIMPKKYFSGAAINGMLQGTQLLVNEYKINIMNYFERKKRQYRYEKQWKFMVIQFMFCTGNVITVIGKKEEQKKLDRKDRGLVEMELLAEMKLLAYRMKLLASTDNTNNIILYR